MEKEKIVFEYIGSSFRLGFYCVLCGDCTGSNLVHVQVVKGEHAGVIACKKCLAAGETRVDVKIQERIEELEEEVATLKSIKGRLDLPTYEQWLEQEKQAEYEVIKAKFNSDEEFYKWLEENLRERIDQAVKSGDVPFWQELPGDSF